MKNQINTVVSSAVTTLLRPLVRLLLRNGIPYKLFADLAKRVYIEVATDEFGIPGRKQSKSRVSVITGISRKEVLRMKRLPLTTDLGATERYNRAARVVSGWVRDSIYHKETGHPADLPFDGQTVCFRQLVNTYSGDAPARAVLDELLRVGTVEKTQEGKIRLLERSYVPKTGEVDKIAILGVDTSHLIATVDHNIRYPDAPFFQRKVCYDNLPDEAIPGLKKVANEKAQALLEQLDQWMSERDRDFNPIVPGTGRQLAGVGVYYFQEDNREEKKA